MRQKTDEIVKSTFQNSVAFEIILKINYDSNNIALNMPIAHITTI